MEEIIVSTYMAKSPFKGTCRKCDKTGQVVYVIVPKDLTKRLIVVCESCVKGE